MESSTFGSECVAGRIAVDLVVEIRYKLRMLGAPIIGSTLLFGDNQSMVLQVTRSHSVLKKRHQANNYHRVREAVAAGIVSIVHCASGWNLADMGTKALPGNVHQRLLLNQVLPPFQCSRECWNKKFPPRTGGASRTPKVPPVTSSDGPGTAGTTPALIGDQVVGQSGIGTDVSRPGLPTGTLMGDVDKFKSVLAPAPEVQQDQDSSISSPPSSLIVKLK